MAARTVVLLDVDDTLLDNDGVKRYLDSVLHEAGGAATQERFWELYEEVRGDLTAVSIPVTLERMRTESQDPAMIDRLSSIVYSTPFRRFVYEGVLDLLHWLRAVAVPVILSDGDPWYQAKKITDAGLGDAVSGNVLIYLHKEEHVDDVRRWYPADRYVAVDDKAQLLGQLKVNFGGCLTTLWNRKGHYAGMPLPADLPPPDYEAATIPDQRATLERLLERR